MASIAIEKTQNRVALSRAPNSPQVIDFSAVPETPQLADFSNGLANGTSDNTIATETPDRERAATPLVQDGERLVNGATSGLSLPQASQEGDETLASTDNSAQRPTDTILTHSSFAGLNGSANALARTLNSTKIDTPRSIENNTIAKVEPDQATSASGPQFAQNDVEASPAFQLPDPIESVQLEPVQRTIDALQASQLKSVNIPLASDKQTLQEQEQEASNTSIFRQGNLYFSLQVSAQVVRDWESKLEKEVRKVVLSTTYKGPIALDFALTGHFKFRLGPSILILCTHKEHVKQVKKAFKQPQFKTFRNSLKIKKIKIRVLLDPGYGPKKGNSARDSDDEMMASIVEDISKSLPIALSVGFIHTNGGHRSTLARLKDSVSESQYAFSTIGGTIELGGKLYGLATGHAFIAIDSPTEREVSSSENLAPSVSSLNTDSEEDDMEDQEDLQISTPEHRVNRPRNISERESLKALEERNDERDGETKVPSWSPAQAKVVAASVGNCKGAVISVFDNRLSTKVSNTRRTAYSDWALIRFSDPTLLPPNRVYSADGGSSVTQGHFRESELKQSSMDGEVLVLGGRSGVQKGTLSSIAATIFLWQTEFVAYRIHLKRRLEPGDSGSWVVRHGHLCGIIVSAGDLLPWAFMLPITRVFADIEEVFGLKTGSVSVPSMIRIGYLQQKGASEDDRIVPQDPTGPPFFRSSGLDALRKIVSRPENMKGRVPVFKEDFTLPENLEMDLIPRALDNLVVLPSSEKSYQPEQSRTLQWYLATGHELVLNEDPNLHLLRTESKIFMKPLPLYLLDNDFLVGNIYPDFKLYHASKSFLWSYFTFLRYQSELDIAYAEMLLPARVPLSTWNLLKGSFFEVGFQFPRMAGSYHHLGRLTLHELVDEAWSRGHARKAQLFTEYLSEKQVQAINPLRFLGPTYTGWLRKWIRASDVYLWLLVILVAIYSIAVNWVSFGFSIFALVVAVLMAIVALLAPLALRLAHSQRVIGLNLQRLLPTEAPGEKEPSALRASTSLDDQVTSRRVRRRSNRLNERDIV